MENRPLALFAICYGLGLALGCIQGIGGQWFWLGGALALAGLVVFRRKTWVFVLAVTLGAAMMYLACQTPALPERGRYQLTGIVRTAETDAEGRCKILLEEPEVDGQAAPGRVLTYVWGWQGETPRRGDRICMEAYVYPSAEKGTVSPFSWRGYTLRMQTHLSASGSMADFAVTQTGRPGPGRWMEGLRARLSAQIDRMYPEDMAPLVKSLTLGLRNELPGEIEDAFSGAGVVHLLALSGLHVSMLAMLLDFLLRRLPIPSGAAFGMVGVMLSLYAVMVGMPASIVRAVCMYLIGGIGRLRKRPADTITSLGAAFLVLTLFTPEKALDAGLLLSFCSILGILYLSPGRLRFGRMPEPLAAGAGYAVQAVCVSLGATLGTLPLTVGMYGRVQPYGILANLILIPLASAALPLAFLSVILGSVWTLPGLPFAAAAGWILRALVWLADGIAGWPGAVVSVRAWNGALIPIFAMCLILASPYVHAPRKSRMVRCAGVAAALLVTGLAMAVPEMMASRVTVRFLDVGQADAAVVQAGDQVWVVDTGEDDTCHEYLRDNRLEVDGLILTHPHSDHAGGAEEILRSGCGTLYVPENWERVYGDEGMDELTALAEGLGWKVVYLSAGDRVDVDDEVSMEVLWPGYGGTETDANEGCLVLQMRYGAADVLFLGDKPAGDQFVMPRAEVVKVAHHGAKNGTDARTAAEISPALAVISVGRNSYGHPNPHTLDCYENTGALILRTDVAGDILVDVYEDGSLRYWIYPN